MTIGVGNEESILAFDGLLPPLSFAVPPRQLPTGSVLQRFHTRKLFAYSRFKNCALRLSQGVFQALCGFLQLALEGFDLLSYVIKLLPGQFPGLRNLLHFAIRVAHGRPNFHRNSREPALPCHRKPPFGTEPSYTRTIPRVIS
jgi:hypothetical protein